MQARYYRMHPFSCGKCCLLFLSKSVGTLSSTDMKRFYNPGVMMSHEYEILCTFYYCAYSLSVRRDNVGIQFEVKLKGFDKVSPYYI